VSREIKAKTGRIVELLETEGFGGVLLNAQHNFAWLTGGASNAIDQGRENGAATIFVRRDGSRYLLANNIEMPRMLAEVVSADAFEPIEFGWQDEKASADILVVKAGALSDGDIACDLAVPKTNLIESKIAPCRYELVPEEVERYRKLGSDTAGAIEKVIEKITPGTSEIDLAARMRAELAAADIASVVTLVAADERIAKFRHPVPTGRRWKKTLLIVTCARRGGLIVSLSRMVAAGRASEELKEKTEAAAFVNASLWNATRAGVTGAELYRTAADAYASAGFADEINNHHQGGATGYKTREWVAHPQSGEVVTTNQAFAWNSSITGTKVEETVIASANAIEVITASSKTSTISNVLNGVPYRSPGIIEK
jgi:Xaa-Pro dipeptidase